MRRGRRAKECNVEFVYRDVYRIGGERGEAGEVGGDG